MRYLYYYLFCDGFNQLCHKHSDKEGVYFALAGDKKVCGVFFLLSFFFSSPSSSFSWSHGFVYWALTLSSAKSIPHWYHPSWSLGQWMYCCCEERLGHLWNKIYCNVWTNMEVWEILWWRVSADWYPSLPIPSSLSLSKYYFITFKRMKPPSSIVLVGCHGGIRSQFYCGSFMLVDFPPPHFFFLFQSLYVPVLILLQLIMLMQPLVLGLKDQQPSTVVTFVMLLCVMFTYHASRFNPLSSAILQIWKQRF